MASTSPDHSVGASALAFAPAAALSVFVLDRVVGGGSADDADAGGANDARNGPADWRTCCGRLEVR